MGSDSTNFVPFNGKVDTGWALKSARREMFEKAHQTMIQLCIPSGLHSFVVCLRLHSAIRSFMDTVFIASVTVALFSRIPTHGSLSMLQLLRPRIQKWARVATGSADILDSPTYWGKTTQQPPCVEMNAALAVQLHSVNCLLRWMHFWVLKPWMFWRQHFCMASLASLHGSRAEVPRKEAT